MAQRGGDKYGSDIEVKQNESTNEAFTITPLGAGCEVGRSCVIVSFKGITVMFDCGVHPGYTGVGALPIFDAINVSSVNFCLVTHFHLDHCGALPYFVNRTDFTGRIFMTEPTKAICKLLWHDYARVSKLAAASGGTFNSNKLGGAKGDGTPWGLECNVDEHWSRKPLFDVEDILRTLEKIETLNFNEEMEVDGIKVCCYGAGHVLGACMFLVEIHGVRVLYTGDYSREDDRHVPGAVIPAVEDVHVLRHVIATRICDTYLRHVFV